MNNEDETRNYHNQENRPLQKDELNQANELDNAIESFNEAMERNPEGDRTQAVELTSEYVDTYEKSEYNKAIENFNEAMERNPEVWKRLCK